MKLFPLFAVLAVISLPPGTLAQPGHSDFSDVQPLLDNPADCSRLADSQLERLGEYFMEQMHPGEAHEAMDKMMGGEGSESLRQAHIRMGEAFYCGTPGTGFGMMGSGMMMGAGMYGYGFGWLYIMAGIIAGLLAIIIILLARRK